MLFISVVGSFLYLFLLCAGGLGGRFLSGLFASGVVVLHPCSVFRSVLYSSYIQVYFSPGVCVPLWWAVVFRGCRLLYGMFSAAQPCPRFRVGKPHHVVVAVQAPPPLANVEEADMVYRKTLEPYSSYVDDVLVVKALA